MKKPIQFHWSLSKAGEKLRAASARSETSGHQSFPAQLEYCLRGEEAGIDSMLMAIGFARPDPMVLTAALARKTSTMKFLIACRSGLLSPTTFVNHVNTVSALTEGRIHLNIVCGHSPRELQYYGDFLCHDERYARTDEFLTICHAFWNGDHPVNFKGKYLEIKGGLLGTPFVHAHRKRPYIYLSGSSDIAVQLAVRHADCLFSLPDTPANFLPRNEVLKAAGKDAGFLVSLITRPTREEALSAAAELINVLDDSSRIAHEKFSGNSDSIGFKNAQERVKESASDWMGPCLWTGAVPFLGPTSIALVGSYEEVADTIMAYKRMHITHFLFMGWPDLEEMAHFKEGVLPLVREKEAIADRKKTSIKSA